MVKARAPEVVRVPDGYGHAFDSDGLSLPCRSCGSGFFGERLQFALLVGCDAYVLLGQVLECGCHAAIFALARLDVAGPAVGGRATIAGCFMDRCYHRAQASSVVVTQLGPPCQ